MPTPIYTTCGGIVEAVDTDPERLGRLKVRVPTVYGPAEGGTISTDDLPWAMPAGLPAGATAESGAMVWLPQVGDAVWVRFLDGLPEQPIWEWGMQTRGQSVRYPYWRRPGGYADGAAPRNTYLTRYGHVVDIAQDGITFATARHYTITIRDASAVPDGFIELATQKGYTVRLDDASDEGSVTAPTTTVNASTLFQAVSPVTHLRSPKVMLGQDANDPVVRLSDLRAAVNTITAWANAHTHIGNLGRPTSPPIAPLQVTPRGSDNTFSV